jgi:hypothetical protein
MKKILVLVLGFFCSLFLVQGYGGNLYAFDDFGTGFMYCSPQYGSFQHTFSPTLYTSHYVFVLKCQIPSGYYNYNTTGAWDWKSRIATEALTSGNLYGLTRCSCPADPWLNDVECTKISTSGNIFGPGVGLIQVDKLPVTRNILDSQPSTRQAWKAELEDKIRHTPPRIVAPQTNSTYKFTFKENVLFRAEAFIPPDFPGSQSWKVWVQFEQMAWPGTGKKQPNVVELLPLSNNFAMKTFLIYPGTWRVRARTTSTAHQGDFSDWVIFKVEAPPLHFDFHGNK